MHCLAEVTNIYPFGARPFRYQKYFPHMPLPSPKALKLDINYVQRPSSFYNAINMLDREFSEGN